MNAVLLCSEGREHVKMQQVTKGCQTGTKAKHKPCGLWPGKLELFC